MSDSDYWYGGFTSAVENAPLDQASVIEFVKPLLGKPVSEAWRGGGTAMFLEISDLDFSGKHPRGEFGVGIEWSWRVEEARTILVGSADEDAEISMAEDLLRGQSILEISIFGTIPEICVQFASGRRLVSFATASGDPEWSVRVADTTAYVKAGQIVFETG